MTQSQVTLDLVALIEEFNRQNITKRQKNAASFDLYRDAINIGNEEEDLFSVLGSTDNALILETFIEYGSGIAGEEILETIAGNQNAPVSVLDRLRKESYKVQHELLANPSTSSETLLYLSRYGDDKGIKIAAANSLKLRKGRTKLEIDGLRAGEATFALQENPYILIPDSSVPKFDMFEMDYGWFKGKEYRPSSNRNYLAKYGEQLYLARLDMSTRKCYVILFLEIERIDDNEFKVLKSLNKYFDFDEL